MPPCGHSVPRKLPFFYGWVVVATGVIVAVLGSHIGSILINTLTMARVSAALRAAASFASQSRVAAQIYDDFEEKGVIRSTVSVCWLIGTLASAVATPFLGAALDRYGTRTCMPLALLTLAAGMLTLGLSETLYTLPLAFFLIRSMSLGAINPFTTACIGQWFNTKRGKAVAVIGTSGQIMTNLVLAPYFQLALDTLGWRQTHIVLALVPVTAALIAALLMCHTPESVGLQPDGVTELPYTGAESEKSDGEDSDREALLGGGGGSSDEEDSASTKPPPSPRTPRQQQYSFTRRQALRTLPIYLLSIDKFFSAIIGAGCSQVLLQVLRENDAKGVDIASHVMLSNGIAQACLPVIIGFLRDKGVPPKYLVSLSSYMVAIGPFAATRIQGPAMAVLYGLNCERTVVSCRLRPSSERCCPATVGSVWGLKMTMAGFLVSAAAAPSVRSPLEASEEAAAHLHSTRTTTAATTSARSNRSTPCSESPARPWGLSSSRA